MEHIIINDHSVKKEDTCLGSSCARAILVDNDNVLVERHPNGAFLLPGFFCEKTFNTELLNYLKCNLGVDYSDKVLEEILLLEHYQKVFSFDEELDIMRLVQTKYFLGKFMGIDYDATKSKDFDTFKLMDIDEIIELTSKESDNNLVKFCNRDTNEALKVLKKVR